MRAGAPVSLADAEDLGGSGRTTVVRARVAQNPVSMDRTLVIKLLPAHEDPRSFQREVVSYQYVTALPTESRPGPQLIASDYEGRLLVLSDLGSGQSMKDLLGGSDTIATSRAVSAWGQALGRMHAATLGGEEDFAALLRRGHAKMGSSADVGERWARRATATAAHGARMLGVEVPPRVADMLTAACALFRGGDHRAFSPSDVGPENILINDAGVQFMDYEWGGFRDATLDVAYAVATFGQHLSAINLGRRAELESALVDAWRSEVEGIWPRLRNDAELNARLLAGWVLWSWLSTMWMLPIDAAGTDSPDGAVSVEDQAMMEDPASVLSHDWALHSNDPRVIVARWTDLADSAQRAGVEPLADFARQLGAALQRSWLA